MGKENLLLMIPERKPHVKWTEDESGSIKLCIERDGIIARILQFVFNAPRKITLDLDEIGSTVWKLCDGKNTIYDIGNALSEKFGDRVEPLYPRLVKFIQMLCSGNYLFLKQKEDS
ncbi:PqqD family protein [Thermosediminibacter oceani]|uniref:Coenzyme PQQ synthesis D n=1 Tax=Thermosediminibacter oceani (strain ATCC BAA-1034 / DSM 16646 / JW/IW-1228P) TaxID=555079 RepID=D9RZ82_THEOJ|nr:PqqD family protein [Thermosediminibacter oceani]ADL08636.1 conserved hypothetical protein [Thermosediminibacter oceani DSM 16646]